jgi:hypothetical protein
MFIRHKPYLVEMPLSRAAGISWYIFDSPFYRLNGLGLDMVPKEKWDAESRFFSFDGPKGAAETRNRGFAKFSFSSVVAPDLTITINIDKGWKSCISLGEDWRFSHQ